MRPVCAARPTRPTGRAQSSSCQSHGRETPATVASSIARFAMQVDAGASPSARAGLRARLRRTGAACADPCGPAAASTPLDTSTPHGRTSADRVADVVGREAAREQDAHRRSARPRRGASRTPCPTRARASRRGSMSAGLLAAARERGIAGRERLDHELHALADPLHLATPARGRAAARRAGRRGPTISTIAFGPLVAEHADGRAPRAAAAARCRGPSRRSTCRAARREHEAERVGVERGREQRVVLVGDPADLDEHALLPGLRRRSGDRG